MVLETRVMGEGFNVFGTIGPQACTTSNGINTIPPPRTKRRQKRVLVGWWIIQVVMMRRACGRREEEGETEFFDGVSIH
jgi:hypothetical protein